MRFAPFAKFTAIATTLIISTQANAAPVRYGTYYDDLQVGTSCSGNYTCQVNFSQLPSDRLLMLSKVNCSINSSQPLATAMVSASTGSGGWSLGRGVSFSLGPALFAANLYFYSFETDARFLIGQGRYPYIQASTSSFVNANFQMSCGNASPFQVSADCVIVGNLSDD
ncbi:hypothetical protein [Bradyrhizobium sp.]|jgi:hypothetical protein|uniref:hypothetical protein n=1 Tax=Bradyrhizobium sp. TaxID=376 RepID=UPI002DDCA26D|nr:hypothetical protein [Bradyrhizobium sp.]HEV2159580.1 hypothetical protein [Bradyrhizobium sp.]